MGFDASGRFLLVTNRDSNNVTVFRVDAETGTATQVEGSPFPAGTRPLAVSSFREQ
jgi:6-phosphogluconolactonase (cycloisomerase 2 family)